MFGGLRAIYKVYGGPLGLLRSSYFWFSVVLFLLSYNAAIKGTWEDLALSILPSLTGFSIASFAIVFAVLRPEQVSALLKKKAGEEAPLLRLFSSITHAILIQVSGVLIAYVRKLSDLSEFADWLVCEQASFDRIIQLIDRSSSAFGLFLSIYGITLLFSIALIIFQMTRTVSKISRQEK